MKSSDDVRCFEHISVHESKVLLTLTVVPKRYNPESPEPRREISDRFDLDADVLCAESPAIMVLITLDEVVESDYGSERLRARN